MKYCLKPEAKEALKEVLGALFVILPLVIIVAWSVFGLAILPLVIAQGSPSNTFGLITGMLGILSWTAVLSLITIVTKRWLQSKIIECKG